MGFTVKNLDREIDQFKRAGIKLMFRAEDEDFGRVAYFDTGDVAGVVMELVEPYDNEIESF